MDRALDAYREVANTCDRPDVRAEALTRLADVLRHRCVWDDALDSARQAQEVARLAQLSQHLMEAVVAEANVYMARGEFDEAARKFEGIATTSSDPRLRGIALQNLGSIHAQRGQRGSAERAFSESLGNFHRAAYTRGEAMALNNLGRLALESNDCATARPLLERALVMARAVEDSDMAAIVSLNLASVMCTEGDLDRAQDLAMAALGHFATCENAFRQIECLRLIGDINQRCDDVANAARCFELALSLAEQIGSAPEIQVSKERLVSLGRR
jgi:tetratricopeptide (TPR) repeat protein